MGPRRNPRAALQVRILTIGVGGASDSGVSPYAHGTANRTDGVSNPNGQTPARRTDSHLSG